MKEWSLILVFKIKSSFLQVWCLKTQSNLARSLAQTSYLNSDASCIIQTHKDRWSSYVSKLQLSFCTCCSQRIYCIAIVFLSCSKVEDFPRCTAKAYALWNSQKKSAIQQRRPCVEMLSEDNSTFNTFRAAWFRRFSQKNSSFQLPYQRPSSSAHCARKLFSSSNGLASLEDCTRKKIFCLGGALFLWVTS